MTQEIKVLESKIEVELTSAAPVARLERFIAERLAVEHELKEERLTAGANSSISKSQTTQTASFSRETTRGAQTQRGAPSRGVPGATSSPVFKVV